MSKVVSLVNYGQVECGRITKANDRRAKPVLNYLGIPFAQPPVGKLRFLPPRKALPWNGILCNKEQIAIPVQNVDILDLYFNFNPQRRVFYKQHCSEDCLYLNVFVPDVCDSSKLPVMVWFYGGSFQRGPTVFMDGTALAGMNDVIVVVPNYRVNTFGFLTLGTGSESKGNLGLLDQLQALKWVQENIEAFGGDADNVTIFGESAGGISVNMHMMSPMSQGLFKKAISFSGSATMARVFVKDQESVLKKLLEILDVQDTEPNKILEKLQSFSVEQIYDANIQLHLAGYAWLPTEDGEFLTDLPSKLLDRGSFEKIPFIIGCNSSEGGWLMNSIAPNYLEGISEEEFRQQSSTLLKHYNRTIDVKKSLPILLKHYNLGSNNKDNMYFTKGLAGIMADATFVNRIINVADKHSDSGAPTYFYHMKHPPYYNHDSNYGPSKALKPSFVGTDHADDIAFTWGVPFSPQIINDSFKFSNDEKELSRSMMTYFTNFAKTGDPNKGVAQNFDWPKYNSENRPHLVLDIPISKDTEFGVVNYVLYTKVLPKL